MIRRHPHIFLEERANNDIKSIDKVLEKWENIKERESGDKTRTDMMTDVPQAFPALTRAVKVQKKAADVGFDWTDVSFAVEKVKEESRELIEERVDFVARELSLLDNKTILKILDGYIDKEKFDGKLKDNNITNINADRGVVEVAVEETKNYLRNDNESENKTELCRKVRKARVAKFVDYRVMIRDTINNFIGSCIFTAIIVAISALVSFLIYDHVANSYFKTIYIIFVAVIGIISELIYWFNFKDRRLRNVVVMSAWQMIFMIFGTIGIYTIMQVVLLSIGG